MRTLCRPSVRMFNSVRICTIQMIALVGLYHLNYNSICNLLCLVSSPLSPLRLITFPPLMNHTKHRIRVILMNKFTNLKAKENGKITTTITTTITREELQKILGLSEMFCSITQKMFSLDLSPRD